MATVAPLGRVEAAESLGATPEAEAAGLLYRRHAPGVLAYCRRRLGSPEEAEDALQTTFLYACRALRQGVVPAFERAWLLKIAENVCLSRWNGTRRRRAFEVDRDPEVLQNVVPSHEPDRDELIPLDEALAGLTEQQRGAILLREWKGLSYREIAAELGLSQAAVETLIFRARRALAQALGADEKAPRRRLARALDFGSLLGALKSLLGGGTAVKIAAGVAMALGTATLAGSSPETSRQHQPLPVAPSPPAGSSYDGATVEPAVRGRPLFPAPGAAAPDGSRPATTDQSTQTGGTESAAEAATAAAGSVLGSVIDATDTLFDSAGAGAAPVLDVVTGAAGSIVQAALPPTASLPSAPQGAADTLLP